LPSPAQLLTLSLFKRLSVDLMGEITAPSDLAAALQGVDTVLHMAYKVKPGGTLDAIREANVGGTRTLLDAAEATGVACVVVTGSATAVGFNRDPALVAEVAAVAGTCRGGCQAFWSLPWWPRIRSKGPLHHCEAHRPLPLVRRPPNARRPRLATAAPA
jgi:nucleoside-diphosphate-sugar epimerase